MFFSASEKKIKKKNGRKIFCWWAKVWVQILCDVQKILKFCQILIWKFVIMKTRMIVGVSLLIACIGELGKKFFFFSNLNTLYGTISGKVLRFQITVKKNCLRASRLLIDMVFSITKRSFFYEIIKSTIG